MVFHLKKNNMGVGMRKILVLSMILTLVSSCGHMYGGRGQHEACGSSTCSECKGCKPGQPCANDKKESGKDDKKEECDDCKKGGKS